MKKGINTHTSSGATLVLPGATLNARSAGRKKKRPKKKKGGRFLDFSISTVQHNSGTQQYGAGQSMARKSRTIRNVAVDPGFAQTPQMDPQSGLIATSQSSYGKTNLVLMEREMFSSVTTTGAPFQLRTFQINPGLESLMPKGSRVAGNFERYRFRRLRIAYVPTVTGYAAAGQQGRVGLAATMNASASPPANLRECQELDPHVPGMPNERIELVLDASGLNLASSWKYVRRGANPAGTDLKLYDPLQLHFYSEGLATSGSIGELHIEYEVELMNIANNDGPVLPPNNWLTVKVLTQTAQLGDNLVHAGTTAGTGGYVPYSTLSSYPSGYPNYTDPGTGLAAITVPTGRYRCLFWALATNPTTVGANLYNLGVATNRTWVSNGVAATGSFAAPRDPAGAAVGYGLITMFSTGSLFALGWQESNVGMDVFENTTGSDQYLFLSWRLAGPAGVSWDLRFFVELQAV